MAVTITDIVTEHGAYYKEGGQNEQRLRETLYRGSDTVEHFITIPTENTREDFANAEGTRVLQPFQKAFTALGDLTFKPVAIDLFKMKIDQSIYPDDIEKSWLGFLAKGGLNRKDWPLIRYVLEKYVTQKKDEDYELNEVYAGVYAAPTPGTAGSAGTAMNGIKKLFIDHIAASLANVVTLGSVPTDDADYCQYIEDFVSGIPHKYRKKLDKIFVSEDKALKYKRGKRALYNTNYAQEELVTIADYPNISVVGLPSMGTSAKAWTTLPENRIRFVKKNANRGTFRVEEAKREVAVLTDFWDGVGFPYPAHLFTNDQDNS